MTDLHNDPLADPTQLRAQIADLRATLDSIRLGGVDAVIAGRPGEEQIYTLTNADRPYRLILEEMNEGAVTVSRRGVILFANPTFERMIGAAEPVVGTPMVDVIVADDRAAVARLLALLPGDRARVEVQLAGADGAVPVLLGASCLEIEGTPVVGIIATDLTSQKEIEAALRDDERRLRDFLDAIPVGVYVASVDGRMQFASPEARRLLNADDATDLAKSVETLGPVPGGGPAPSGPLARTLAGETTHVDDIAVTDPAGGSRLLEAWGTPVPDAHGHPEYAILALADITTRRAAERDIARQAAMLELGHDAVLMWDAQGRTSFWNKGAETLYGYPREQVLGTAAHELLQTHWPAPRETIMADLQRDGSWEGELEQRCRDGELIIVMSRLAEHRGPAGELIGVLEVNRDITARKRAEQSLAERAAELEELNHELERSNAELEQFAYAASHDLSEPLRAISGHVSLLAARYRGRLGPEADESIGFAVDGCARMQQTIRDLLLYSRVGRIETPATEVDCVDAVRAALSALQKRLEQSDAEVTVEELPVVTAEPDQLVQVFTNLISNAVKFVKPGVRPLVTVAAERGPHEWRFTITDNGIGVPSRHRERIFGMFKRLHPSDEYPGTGIGLAVVRKSVERHGGHVGVDDAPSGSGSQFWFTVPDPDVAGRRSTTQQSVREAPLQ